MMNERSAGPDGIALPFRLQERVLETLADMAGIGIVLISREANLMYVNGVAKALWCPSGISPTMSCAADLWRQILSQAPDPENILEQIRNIGRCPEYSGEFRFKISGDRYVTAQTTPCDTGAGSPGRLWTFRQTERRARGHSATIAQLVELLGSIIQAGIVAGEGLELALGAGRYRSEVERCAQQALTLVQQMSSDRRQETRRNHNRRD